MATLIRTTARLILLAIRQRLSDRLSLPPEAVVVTALPLDDVPSPLGERDILLAAANEVPNNWRDGGGRYVNGRKRTFKVGVRTRLHLDEPDRDLVRLTDASLGHLVFEDDVVNALEGWFPLQGEDALCLPLLCGEISPASRGMIGQHRERSARLLSWFPVTAVYTRDLALPEAGEEA